MAASAQVHSVVSVESVVQLRTALASSSCQKVIITQDIEVDEDSWPADDVVSILNRTVVVTSAESLGATPQSWPLLNANYMFWRISLKENATLIFRRLWLARLNTLNVIAYPGAFLVWALAMCMEDFAVS